MPLILKEKNTNILFDGGMGKPKTKREKERELLVLKSITDDNNLPQM